MPGLRRHNSRMPQENEPLHVYLRHIHPDESSSLAAIAAFVPEGARVLDLGCGSGALGEHLTATKACICDGVTLNAAEADIARPHYRQIEVADLETADLRQRFADQRYDAIVCADVLEHLRHPEHILQTCATLLKAKGKVHISVPNAAYAGLLIELMHGDFRYRAEGLLDRTHLRFFTRQSLTRFLRENGWRVDALQPIRRQLWDSEFTTAPDTLPPAVARYLLSRPDALTYQFIAAICPGEPRATQPMAGEHGDTPPPAAFTVQLYWGDNGLYEEDRKHVVEGAIGTMRQVLHLALPALTATAPRLRLDPADRPGFLHLHSLALRNAEGRICWRWDMSTPGTSLQSQRQQHIHWAPPLATAPGTALLLLTADDPWIELPIPPATLATCLRTPGSRLEVELGWPMSADHALLAHTTRELQTRAAYAEQRLAHLQQRGHEADWALAQQNTQLQERNAQLSQRIHALENSSLYRATRPLARLKRKARQLLAAATPPPAPAAEPGASAPPAAKTAAAPHPVVDIIIPVHGGLTDTQRCIAGVLASTDTTAHRIIVINDASPEPALSLWLQNLADREPRITLLENTQNLGFVQTANRGMALSGEHDVVLLNSDTIVSSNWLDRLRQAAWREPRIGTATPLSNNATICSYPRFCANNPLPRGYDSAALDALCASTLPAISSDIPTAVGFCMYIRRDCLTQTGPFDATHFGVGYGEENDFCLRATALGWRHVLALDTFVQHVGGVSFGPAKAEREAAAQATLHQLHPGYAATIQAHLVADPARPHRQALDLARLKASPLPRTLAILHGVGGGTLRHVHELADHLHERCHTLILTPLPDYILRLQWIDRHEAFERDYHWPTQGQALIALLREIGIHHIHYHHLLGVDPALMHLPAQLGVAYDFTAHDYYSACPQISLTLANHAYCGERGIDQCNACLAERPAPTGETILDWRLRHRIFLNGTRYVLAPSLDAAHRMARYFPEANIRYAPHLDMALGAPLPPPAARRLMPDAHLRVFVLGALSLVKGASTLKIVAQEAARLRAPIQLHLLGYPNRPMPQQPHASLTIHGPYEDADLPMLLQRLQPDLVWFPALWPETYSYTLSAALQAGLPILAPALGAFTERLASRAWTWLQPWDTLPGNWLALMLQLREQHFIPGLAPPPAPAAPSDELHVQLPPWDYDRDYLPDL